jgi:branched-chain amino acid transport system substrate-binding protein
LRRSSPLALLCCAAALTGCLGGGGSSEPSAAGHTLTVYASLPRHGVSAPAAAAVAAGQRLALKDAGGHAGRFRIRLVELDSTRPGERIWDPAQVSANAKRAIHDPAAIAYLGDLDYGASAISLPLTNDHGLLQIAPEDGLTSLTRMPPASPREGPERYYPSGRRTFLRLTPSDLLEADALLRRARRLGVRRPAVVSDEGIYGRELAGALVAHGRREGLSPVLSEELEAGPGPIADLVKKLGDARADGVLYAGVAGPASRPLLAGLAGRLPAAPVLASGGVAALGAGPPVRTAPSRVEALTPVLPASAYPRTSRRLLRRLARQGGAEAARADALYGYESMRVALHAIREEGANRVGVAHVALVPGPRRSPIGRYEVRPSGDVTADRFALLRLAGGRFRLESLVRR